MGSTTYTPNVVSSQTTITHRLIPKRSGKIDWNGIGLAGKGAVRIIQINQATGLWVISQQYYGGTNMEIKERLRVLRQANPGWIHWPKQVVPAGTPLVLPPAAKQLLTVPGAGKIVLDRGGSLSGIIAAYYKKNRGVTLTAAQIVKLVPTVAIANGIFDIDNELEPGWVIYVPDEAVDNACGTVLCTSNAHDTSQSDTLGQLELKFGVKGEDGNLIDLGELGYYSAEALFSEILGRSLAGELNQDVRLVKDLLRKNSVKINFVKDASRRITHITIKGSNRELANALGLNGTRYRVGSTAYEAAMKKYATETGQMAARTSIMATSLKALTNTGKSLAKGTLIGTGITLAMDAGPYVVNGEADKILTREFAVKAGNNVANNMIASGAGVAASAITVAAMSAAGCSVVPGIGTAVGFVVGFGVAVALSYFDVRWVK